jgi:hypothetical protein
MAPNVRKPVKVLTDLETRKQILKTDSSGNVLFKVSGSLGDGAISSSFPFTGSSAYFTNDVTVDGKLKANKFEVTTLVNSINYETSISASINALLDVSASNAQIDDFLKWDGNNWVADIVSNATSASYAATAAYAETTTFDPTQIIHAYKRLRYQEIGYFDASGSALIQLPTGAYGGSAFPTASLDYVNVSVFVKDGTLWTNDILAVSVYESSSYIYVSLEAPELTDTDQYKLLAVNEDPTYYTI